MQLIGSTRGHYDIIYQSYQHDDAHRGDGHDITVNAVMDVSYAGQYSQPSNFLVSQPDDVNLLAWFPSDLLPQQPLHSLVNNDQTVFSNKESTMEFQPHSSSSSSLITPLPTPSPTQGLILPPKALPPSRTLLHCLDSQPMLSPHHDVPFALLPAADGAGQMLPNPPHPLCEAPPASKPKPRKREKQCLSSFGWE